MKHKSLRVLFTLILFACGLYLIPYSLIKIINFIRSIAYGSPIGIFSILTQICIGLPTLVIGILCIILPVYKLPEAFLQRICRIAMMLLAAGALAAAIDLLLSGSTSCIPVPQSVKAILFMLPCVLVSHIGKCMQAEGTPLWLPILRGESSPEAAPDLRSLFFRLGRVLLPAAALCLLLNALAIITFHPSLMLRAGRDALDFWLTTYVFDYSLIPFVFFALPGGILALIAFFKASHRRILLILAAAFAFLAVISSGITIILQFGLQQIWLLSSLPIWAPIAILICIFCYAGKKAK